MFATIVSSTRAVLDDGKSLRPRCPEGVEPVVVLRAGLAIMMDVLDRLIQTMAPAPFSFAELFSYDLAGNRLTATNRRDKTTTYDYDA